MNRMSLVALLLVVPVLAGCGPTATESPALIESSPVAKVPSPTEPPAPTDASYASENRPLVSTYIMSQGFIDLDPAYGYAEENTVLNQCYENLIWYSPPGSEDELASCTIITTQSNELMQTIHVRMPVVLPFEICNRWLDPALTDSTELLSVLRPYDSERMDVFPVSGYVNSPGHDDPRCIERIEDWN